MKSSLKNKTIIIGIIVLFTVGCRKDPPHVEEPPIVDTTCYEDACNPLPDDGGIGFNYILDGPQYLNPCFNPNNATEFVYIRTGVAATTELIKYNLETKVETVLLNTLYISGEPTWGKQGWIIFGTDKKIWKIKDDGTALTQLTFGIYDLYPTFNNAGDRIIYYRGKTYNNAQLSANPDLFNEYKMMVIDLNGIELDSVTASNVIPGDYYQKWEFGTVGENDLYYFVGGSGASAGFYSINPALDAVSPAYIKSLYTNGGMITSMDYNNGFIYYSNFWNAIYKVDVNTGTETQVVTGCQTRYHNDLSISPGGSELLVERVKLTPINNYDIDEAHEIWAISLDSCCQVKILGN